MSARLFALLLAATALLMPLSAAAQEDPATARLVQCQKELNIYGTLYVERRGRTVQAVARGLISAEEAHLINDCASFRQGTRLRSRDGYPLYASARGCPRNAPILYRGNLYCFRGR